MYLLDTNIISELRKQDKANPGVQQFFDDAIAQEAKLYLSVITIGELRRGVRNCNIIPDHTYSCLFKNE